MQPPQSFCQVENCNKRAPYKCPRCTITYCSVVCYQTHSTECVAQFAKASTEHLKGVKVTSRERSDFNRILADFRRDDDFKAPTEVELLSSLDDEDDTNDDEEAVHLLQQLMTSLDEDGKQALFSLLNSGMEEAARSSSFPAEEQTPPPLKPETAPTGTRAPSHRDSTENTIDIAASLEQLTEDMEEMDLSYEQILSRMPQQLVRDFENKLNDGRVHKVLSVWTPWWVVEQTDSIDSLHEKLPPLPKSEDLIVPLNVPRRKASALVIHNVVEVIAAHCFVLRLYNGEWNADVIQVANKIWQCSAVLSEDERFSCTTEACLRSKERIANVSGSGIIAIEILNDASAVLSGCSDWVSRALFNCQRIFSSALSQTCDAPARRLLKVRVRKIGYLVSWSLGQDSSSFTVAAREVLSNVERARGNSEQIALAERLKITSETKAGITILN